MLTKRLAGNFAANLFTQFVNVVWQLGSVPVFLAFWPKEHYGEWLLLYSVPGYLALADAGLSTVTANEVAMLVADQQIARARSSLHTACGFLAMISGVVALLLCGAAWLVPWVSWMGLRQVEHREAAWVILLLGIYTLAGLVYPFLGAIYRAVYQAPRHLYFYSLSRLVELIGACLCVKWSYSFITLASVLVGVRIISVVLMYLDCLRISPGLKPGFSEFSKVELRRIITPSLLFMIFPLGNALYFQGMTILVGRVMGPAAVVVFNTVRVLTRAIPQAVTVIKHSAWTELSYLFGARDFRRARYLVGFTMEVTGIAIVVIGSMLYACGTWMLQLWTHYTVNISQVILLVFLLGAGLNSLWVVCSGALMSANRHENLSLWYLTSTVIALVTTALVAKSYGIIGAGWAMVLCEGLVLPYVLLATCRLLELPVRVFLIDMVRFRYTRQLLHERRGHSV